MSADSYFLTQTVNFLIVTRILFLWTKGTYTTRDTQEAMKLLLVVIGAALVSDFVVSSTKLGDGTGAMEFSCERISAGFWHCAGWPVVWDVAARAIGSFLAFVKPGLGVPAAAAGLVAQAYLARQLSARIDFHWRDLMNFFFWSFLVYLFLFNIEWVLLLLTSSFEKVSFLSLRVAEGKKVLESWLATAMPYLDGSLEFVSLFNPKYLIVALSISLLGFLISVQSFAIITVIFLMLAFIPLATFKDVLSNKSEKLEGAIKKIMTLLFLGVVKDINWTLISFFPSLPEPTIHNGKVLLSWASAFQIAGMTAAFLVMLFFAYKLAFIGGTYALKSLFK